MVLALIWKTWKTNFWMHNTIFIDAGDCLTYDDNWLRSELTHPSLCLLNVTHNDVHSLCVCASHISKFNCMEALHPKKHSLKNPHVAQVCVNEDKISLIVMSRERKKKRINIWESWLQAYLCWNLRCKTENWFLHENRGKWEVQLKEKKRRDNYCVLTIMLVGIHFKIRFFKILSKRENLGSHSASNFSFGGR